ncbi:MAG TPA: hypothetical protein VIS48_13390 [Candidatus Kryptonia bacterium]
MRPKIKFFFIGILAGALLAGCNINVNNNSQSEYGENFSITQPLGQRGGISIENINGNINVVGDDTVTSVIISGRKTVQDQSVDEAKSHIGDIEISTVLTDSVVELRTTQPNSSGDRNYRVDYNIRVPKNWTVSINNVNGSVDVQDINNSVGISQVNGTITAEDIAGSVESNLTNGNIYGRVTLPQNGECTLSTLNGNILLAVPTSTSASVTASVLNGSVSVSNLSLTLASSSRTSLKGTLGTGEGTISLSALNGTVELTSY